MASEKKGDAVVADLLSFLEASPSPFHAVQAAEERLLKHNFKRISEKNPEEWKIQANGRYFFTRNQSSLFAFVAGGKWQPGNGFSIVAAHTDSPCLKVKPISNKNKIGFQQLGVEVYGGGLWHTWFDRDLSLAGRVIVANEDGKGFTSRLVRIDRPILRIPTLAIHLNREVNEKGFEFNKETHLLPILASNIKWNLSGEKDDTAARHPPALLKILAEELKVKASQINDFELCLYDTQPPLLMGALDEFVVSARLDNLCMSFCAVTSLINSLSDPSLANEKNVRFIGLFDNEEVGSESEHGASSHLLLSTLTRLTGTGDVPAAISKSMLVSADMAHAVHPNYSEKHEEHNRPHMHKGLVIKHNANQRYATTAVTAFALRYLAEKHRIPVQDFCVRNDSLCGSTIGPILSANCGMRTVDVGVPQWSMHSIRETCGASDVVSATILLTHFFNEFSAHDETVKID